MKRAFGIILAFALLASACGNRNAKQAAQQAAEAGKVSIVDSITMIEGLGDIIELDYEGIIPGADTPGIVYTLKLYKQALADNGTYALTKTYVDSREVENKNFQSYGRWTTAYTGGHNIIGLLPYDDEREDMYFYDLGERGLQMLDMYMQPILSDLNYTLEKI